MNVRAASQRAIARDTIRARQQLVSLKGGGLFLREANVTPEVSPGGVVDIKTVVSNGNLGTPWWDPDSCVNDANECTKGPFETGGYCYELEVFPDWATGQTTGPTCIGTTEIGTVDQEQAFTVTAPSEEGTYVVAIRLTADGSGESGTFHRQVTVTSEAGDRPGPGDACEGHADCNHGELCKQGQCKECGFVDRITNPGQCGTGGVEGTINLLIILVVLILLVSVVAD